MKLRLIDFKTLCHLCINNGKNHQEYGRLCPHPDRCLAPAQGAKNKETCPIWKELKKK